MSIQRNDLPGEARVLLRSWFSSFNHGWRRTIPFALLAVLVVIFGLAAAIVISAAFLGIVCIVAVFRANNRWIRSESKPGKQRKKSPRKS